MDKDKTDKLTLDRGVLKLIMEWTGVNLPYNKRPLKIKE